MSAIDKLLTEGRGKLLNGLRDKWAAWWGREAGRILGPMLQGLPSGGGRLGRFWAQCGKAQWRCG